MRGRKPAWQKRLALSRIRRLFDLARQRVRDRPDLSRRYLYLAKRIGMKYLVRIPRRLKMRMCKHCFSYLEPGVSAKYRFEGGIMKITCFHCKKTIKRYVADKNEGGQNACS